MSKIIDTETCYYCEKNKPLTNGVEIYSSPFDETPNIEYKFCSDRCEDSFNGEIIFCDICERVILNSKGDLPYFQGNNYDYICLQCYEKELLKNGQPRTDYEDDGTIKGGTFFDLENIKLKTVGFEEHNTYNIHDQYDINRLNWDAEELIDSGYQVVTAFDSVARNGGKRTVTLMEREGKNNKMSYPGDKKRGKTGKCLVCGSPSNLWVLILAPGGGWRLLCPLWNKNKTLHNKISEFQYEISKTHSTSLKKILQKDLKKELKKLGPKLRNVTD